MKLSRIILCVILTIATTACAKEKKTNSNRQSKEYLDAWVQKNYPEAQSTTHGAYLLEEQTGSGNLYTGEKYAYVTYITRKLDGKVTETNDEAMSKQIGSYVKGDYYGPEVWYVSDEALTVGMKDLFAGMKVGGSRKMLIPGWLNTMEELSDPDKYLDNKKASDEHSIVELTLEKLVNDITLQQISDIQEYNQEHYGKLDSLSYGFYYKELREPSNRDPFNATNILKINYTGRLLNGQVFDTTIKDTAKKYDIFNPNASYETMEIRWAEKVEDVAIYDSASGKDVEPKLGFSKILWEMKRDGKSVGIFYSDLGYKDSGSGKRIPAYAPLIFEIEIVEVTN